MDYNLTNKQKTIVNPILEKCGEVIIPNSIIIESDMPWFVSFKTYNKKGQVFIYAFNFDAKKYRKCSIKIDIVSKIIEF